MMFGFHNGVGWAGWMLMAMAMIAFWGLVVYGIVALFRSGSPSATGPSDTAADPRQILDERFARGEIELDEYQARRSALVEVANSGRRGGVRSGARPQ